jgi:hypothetical protein
MFYVSALKYKAKSLGWLIFLGLLVAPASAHTVKVSGDVAALFHINPNHNPRAGQQSLAWFELTRRGGQQIPFEQCIANWRFTLNRIRKALKR